MKEKGKQVTVDILVDNETAYLTDYNAIQRVSLNKLVFTHGHSVSNQSITQSFYFRNKPISEIDRKTGKTEETTKTLLKLLKQCHRLHTL